jgi:hypothetical protein
VENFFGGSLCWLSLGFEREREIPGRCEMELECGMWNVEFGIGIERWELCVGSSFGACFVGLWHGRSVRRNPGLGRRWHLIWTGCSEGDGELSGAGIGSLG